jgi:chromosome partitioning protein
MAIVTAVASQKGGVAKSTTSINLSAGLAKKGKKVLLIDIDPQANSSRVLLHSYSGLRKEDTLWNTIINNMPLKLYPTGIDGLQIVPSSIVLSNADIDLQAVFKREERLKLHLDEIRGKFDYVFIDCPPSLSWLTFNALVASDKVLVPVSPGFFELESLIQINKTIHEIQQINPSLEIAGYLFTMGDNTTNSKFTLKMLRQTYPEYCLANLIPKNVDAKDASSAKMDIFSFNQKANAAIAYLKVIEEVYGVK